MLQPMRHPRHRADLESTSLRTPQCERFVGQTGNWAPADYFRVARHPDAIHVPEAKFGCQASEISLSNSEQVDSPEELLKTVVGAIAIKDRIDGEVSHPDGVIVIRCLQPF